MKARRFFIALLAMIVVALPAFALASPFDYVQLFSNTPFCGGIGEPECETVYKISIPLVAPIAVNQDTFKISFRKETDMRLAKDLPEVKDIRMYLDGKPLDRDSLSETFAPGTYYLRVTGKRQWVFNGNEYETRPIDNVLTAFGYDHTEATWWNTSKNYKQNFTIVQLPTIAHNISVIYNANYSDEFAAGKIDQVGTCLQITNGSENMAIPFEHEKGDLTQVNYTAFIFQNFPGAGNYTFWAYYDIGNCNEGYDSASTRWNETGAMIVTHFNLNPNNGSIFHDSAGGEYNGTINGSVGIGRGKLSHTSYFTSSALGSIDFLGNKVNNMPEGTAIFWLNFTSTNNQFIATRGSLVAYDLTVGITSGNIYCSLDGTGTSVTDASIFATNTLYMLVCNWNSTGLRIFKNGIFKSSLGTATGGIPNSIGRKLTLGALQSYNLQRMNGSIEEFQLYNRSLTAEEIIAIYNSTQSLYGTEENYTTTPGITPGNWTSVVAFDETTSASIYFNATFNNGSSTFTTPNTANYTNQSIYFPFGQNTITFYNASYYPRTVIVSISNSSFDISAYLIPLTYPNAIYVRFHALSQTLIPIAAATFTFSRNIGGTMTVIGSCLTDSTGVCAAYLDSIQSYSITAAAGGFDSQSQNIIPVGNDYTFTLSVSSEITYPESYANLSFSLFPFLLNLPQNWTVINFTVISTDNALSSWGLNISYNGAVIFNQTNFTSNGGTVLVNVSFVGREGNLTATGWFQKAGESIIYYSQKYTIYGNAAIKAGSLESLMASVRTGGKSPFIIGFLIILITATIIGGLNKILVIGAGVGLITAFMLVFFAGFLLPLGVDAPEWGFLGLLVFLGAAMLKIRSGA